MPELPPVRDIRPRVPVPEYRQGHPLMPQHPFRAICAGRSGSGKTLAMLNTLPHLAFDHLCAIAPTIDNPQYQTLAAVLEDYEIANEEAVALLSDDISDLPEISSLDPSKQTMIIFDDLIGTLNNRQLTPAIQTFVRGRHQNASSYFLSQSYHKIPKTVRLQASYVMVFAGQNERDRRAIWSDHVSDLTWKEFDKLYRECCDPRYGFMVIDNVNRDLRLRKGWDEIYEPENPST